MRAFLVGLLLFALFFVFGRWYFVCETRGHCEEQEVAQIDERLKTLYLKDGEKVIAGPFEHFLFEKDEIQPSINASNEVLMDKLVAFLAENPDKSVKVYGAYLEGEKQPNVGIIENLGIARASALEDLLVERGIDQSRIETLSKVAATLDDMKKPIQLELFDNTAAQKYDIPQYRFENNTFSDSNFESGSAVFKPGKRFEAYADTMKTFLSINPNFILTITGHTDSVDTEEYNFNLGLERAKAAKDYFEKVQGVTTSINTDSKGETQFAAPNTNADKTPNVEGMKKNRRVNFKLDPVEK